MFVSEQAIRWGLEALRMQFVAALSAAILSASPVLQMARACGALASDVVPTAHEICASTSSIGLGVLARTVREPPIE